MTLRAADAAIDGMSLGRHGERDLLWVDISTLDGVGHAFGTLSWERFDTVLRMHDELSAFVTRVRKRVGPDRVSFVLTSDHAVSPIPEIAAALRYPAFRLPVSEVEAAVEAALDKAFAARVGKR